MRWRPVHAGVAAAALLLIALPWRIAAAPAPTPAFETRSGREIYQHFHDGLADPVCERDSSSARWRRHFAKAPQRLVASDEDTLALFGYVVDALRAASLPTEYALIPFIESGYKPGARSPGGPAGMWQLIKVTARNHDIKIGNGYDGRLSPVDSTRAAVRYLKTLHGMFAGDWRLAVMAYNAGEYRVLGALRRSGQVARDAEPEKLTSLSGITRAYVRKLHALSCLLDRADDDPQWTQAMERPVPVLATQALPPQATSLAAWAKAQDLDPARVRRLNPAYAGGRVARAGRGGQVLVRQRPATGEATVATGDDHASARNLVATVVPATATTDPVPATHVVARGESAWAIARRYHLNLAELLRRNGLVASSVLRPGIVLRLHDDAGAGNGSGTRGGAGE